MNWFKISLQLNKFPINRAQKLLREIQDIPELNFEDYVNNRRKAIVNYHLSYNSFYKNFFGNTDFETWEKVPVMQKSNLQRHLFLKFGKE